MGGSTSWVWSVALHLLIGVSGAFAGVSLVAAFVGGGLDAFRPSERDVLAAGAISFGVLGYAIATVLGGVGLWRGSRAGWWLALIVDLVGLGVLVFALSITSFSDGLLLGGLALWLGTITLLLAPATRAAVRR